MTEEQCAEKIKQKELELTKKLKLQHEKEIKAVTQRCIKDKQAVRIEVSPLLHSALCRLFGVEAEADKKTMGLETARVKKRLIEAEREKHQAACQAAQAQRDARSLKNQIKEVEGKTHEMTAALKRMTESSRDADKKFEKYRHEKQGEIQKLTEQILNLEAKLNNQEDHWNDRCDALLKVRDCRAQTVQSLGCRTLNMKKRHWHRG